MILPLVDRCSGEPDYKKDKGIEELKQTWLEIVCLSFI